MSAQRHRAFAGRARHAFIDQLAVNVNQVAVLNCAKGRSSAGVVCGTLRRQRQASGESGYVKNGRVGLRQAFQSVLAWTAHPHPDVIRGWAAATQCKHVLPGWFKEAAATNAATVAVA